jgi:type IV pilus assembly protein PilX
MMNDQQLVSNKQQGIVLFIALIALVVMSLAAAALIRSVDTNTKIAGNLSFKQSALTSADRGVETAINWLQAQSLTNLNTTKAAQAYFAVYGDLDANGTKDSKVGNLDEAQTLKNAATWSAYSAVATGTGITGGKEDDSKNTIRYIIERMCELTGEPAKDTTNRCLFGTAVSGGDSQGDADQEGIQIRGNGDSINPMYRVTVRVTGPQNTESYTQVYVY